ncbi:alpha/beta hydrolase [Nitrincola alkalilacustris]|uniref:alpha/beta hydrolase n=1 Tax=Nitrincola alkalilacustris TaxID=1571224 RepID=UPI00124EE01B|nr:alpha/beta fold hydrolase [Nitrincola alkalilacustris]
MHYQDLKMGDGVERVKRGAAVFTAAGVRESLSEFDPLEDTLCGPMLRDYLTFYGLDQLAEDAGYSIGTLFLEGAELVVQHFRVQRPLGTVLVVHGFTDHAGIYVHLIRYLLARRWNVLIYDLPGHGLSGGEPLMVDEFGTYVRQLGGLMRGYRRELVQPMVLLGQSTGGAIAMTHQIVQPDLPVARQILLAPLIRPNHMRLIEVKYRWFSWMLKRIHRTYTDNSADQAFLDFVRREDPLQYRSISVRWIGAMLEWVKWIESVQQQQARPLVIQGTADQTVEWQHNLEVLRRIYTDPEIFMIESARHHLVNEAIPVRREVFGAIGQALKAVVAEKAEG